MLKDTNIGLTGTDLAITESTLYDASANLIQDGTAAQQSTARGRAGRLRRAGSSPCCRARRWWATPSPWPARRIFGTNRPTPAAAGVCTPNLGEARLYALSFKDASATKENNAQRRTDARRPLSSASRRRLSALLRTASRSSINNKIHQGVVSGTQVLTAPVQAGKRKRTFWFLEFDK